MLAIDELHPVWVNDTHPVTSEGVYYTNFLYELINTTIAENEHELIRNNTDPSNLSPLFNYVVPSVDEDQAGSKGRLLRIHKPDESVELNKYVKNLQKNLVPESWKDHYKT